MFKKLSSSHREDEQERTNPGQQASYAVLLEESRGEMVWEGTDLAVEVERTQLGLHAGEDRV